MKKNILFFFVFVSAFACQHRQEKYTYQPILKEAVGVTNKDSIAAPVVIFIDKTNTPKTIVAGKPVTRLNPNPAGLGSPNFTHYNTEQGLALSTIFWGFCDKKGNLWFGTDGGGVSRYDGKSFTNFNTTHGLAGYSVFTITEDKSGKLWFGTNGGVSSYDGKSFANFTTAQGLANNLVYHIAEDKLGNLWFGTDGNGVSRYDGKSFTNFTTVQGLAGEAVYTITEDRTGRLWFGTNRGVSCYDGKSFANFTAVQGLANTAVSGITEDDAGNLWFGTFGSGVCRYDGKLFTNFTTTDGLASNDVISITKDKTGKLWFGTKEGVSCFDGKSFTNFTTAQGLTNNAVYSITEDKTGNLWFCTFGSGVSRYDGRSFTNFTTAEGLTNNVVLNAWEDKTGSLWFGTSGGGVSRYDGQSFVNFTTAQGLINNSVNSITEDRSGNLWFGTSRSGVSRYDGQSFTSFTTAQGLVNNAIRCITADQSGNMWFGTRDGVSRFDGRSFTNYTTAQGLINNSVADITVDRTGKLWFGTEGGMSCYDGSSFTNFTNAQGLASNDIANITEDNMGNLWIGTLGGGLSRYDGKSFINFTTTQGMTDNNVWALAIGLSGSLFMGNNVGMIVLKGFRSAISDPPANTKMIPAVNALPNEALKNYQPVFEQYSSETGYPVKDPLPNAMFADSKGVIWEGGFKLVRFDYDALLQDTAPPAVFIQAVKVHEENLSWNNLTNKRESIPGLDSMVMLNEEMLSFGRELSGFERGAMNRKFSGITFDSISPFYPVPQNLVLPYIHNRISFDFVAIQPARNFLVRYQYMLEGYENDWSPVVNKTSAAYGNLDEGTYVFKLRAQTPNSHWSDPVAYSFKVLPPWYRTWWAYILYILVTLLALWIFVKWRIQAVKNENKALEQKVSERTRELEQSMLEKFELSKKIESQQALMNERLRISRELHDDIGSTLGSISIYSEVAKNRFEKNENTNEVISKIGLASRELIEKMSDIVWSLHPGNESLEQLQNRMMAFAAMLLAPRNICYDFTSGQELKSLVLTSEQRKNIFLIFKEAIYNSVKYASCKNIDILFTAQSNRLTMIIRDDGKGFEMQQISTLSNGEYLGGNGINNMKARAKDMNAELHFDSTAKEGTTIHLTLNLSK